MDWYRNRASFEGKWLPDSFSKSFIVFFRTLPLTLMNEDLTSFQKAIQAGLPASLPEYFGRDSTMQHAPVRSISSLSIEERRLALANALRYFPETLHAALAPEFAEELIQYGRIYMYRYRPSYPMHSRPIDHYPANCRQAAAIMLMIQNNLDPLVAK